MPRKYKEFKDVIQDFPNEDVKKAIEAYELDRRAYYLESSVANFAREMESRGYRLDEVRDLMKKL